MSTNPDGATALGTAETEGTDYRAFDGRSYGRSYAFDEETGDFIRTSRREVRVITGPSKVAYELVRVLKTPIGDDPIRPNLGLDKRKLLGTSELQAKQAIIDAIGPESDPRVERLNTDDITITQPEGVRENAKIRVRAVLTAEGTPIEFATTFEDLTRGGYPSRE